MEIKSIHCINCNKQNGLIKMISKYYQEPGTLTDEREIERYMPDIALTDIEIIALREQALAEMRAPKRCDYVSTEEEMYTEQ